MSARQRWRGSRDWTIGSTSWRSVCSVLRLATAVTLRLMLRWPHSPLPSPLVSPRARATDMRPFPQTTLPAHLKQPQGRPSEYREEYDQLVIEFMGQGFSLTAFAGHIRVARDTVYEWIKRHASFSDAVARARPARV